MIQPFDTGQLHIEGTYDSRNFPDEGSLWSGIENCIEGFSRYYSPNDHINPGTRFIDYYQKFQYDFVTKIQFPMAGPGGPWTAAQTFNAMVRLYAHVQLHEHLLLTHPFRINIYSNGALKIVCGVYLELGQPVRLLDRPTFHVKAYRFPTGDPSMPQVQSLLDGLENDLRADLQRHPPSETVRRVNYYEGSGALETPALDIEEEQAPITFADLLDVVAAIRKNYRRKGISGRMFLDFFDDEGGRPGVGCGYLMLTSSSHFIGPNDAVIDKRPIDVS